MLNDIRECITLQKLFNAKYFYAKYYDSKIYGNMKNMCHAEIDSQLTDGREAGRWARLGRCHHTQV